MSLPRKKMKLNAPRTTAASFVVAAALAVTACGSSDRDAPAPNPVDMAAVSTTSAASSSVAPSADSSTRDFADLEKSFDVRLGVFALDTQTGRTVTWRGGERFAFASTIKAPLSAAVLDRVSRKDLSRVIRFDEDDLVPYSPITEKHLENGMTLRAVIDAALRFSDNTAANLLYDEIGGPDGLDRALDRVGDRVTDPERVEPDLNTAIPGDSRDTTTPRALATTVGTYVVGNALPRYDRDLLRSTMINNTTGDELIRAGVPDGWVVADKTGSADYGVRNDVAIAFPPGRSPILIAVMTTRDGVDDPYDNAAVAGATRIAVDALK
jgi:beta-lactamase class A